MKNNIKHILHWQIFLFILPPQNILPFKLFVGGLSFSTKIGVALSFDCPLWKMQILQIIIIKSTNHELH